MFLWRPAAAKMILRVARNAACRRKRSSTCVMSNQLMSNAATSSIRVVPIPRAHAAHADVVDIPLIKKRLSVRRSHALSSTHSGAIAYLRVILGSRILGSLRSRAPPSSSTCRSRALRPRLCWWLAQRLQAARTVQRTIQRRSRRQARAVSAGWWRLSVVLGSVGR